MDTSARDRHFYLYSRFVSVISTVHYMRRLAVADGYLPPDIPVVTDEEIATQAFERATYFNDKWAAKNAVFCFGPKPAKDEKA